MGRRQCELEGCSKGVKGMGRCVRLQVESLAVMQSARSSLRHLSLSRATAVTDESIDVLADSLTNLTRLDLSFCSVTEPGLQKLQPLRQLNRLDIHGYVKIGLEADQPLRLTFDYGSQRA